MSHLLPDSPKVRVRDVHYELWCRAFTLWAKTDTFREETDECSETACRSEDGGM
jgi:hypothetical protein